MELQFGNTAERKTAEEISSLLYRTEKENTTSSRKKRIPTIKFDLSDNIKNKFLPHYNSLLRKEILEEITLDELENSSEFLNEEVSCLLKEVTDFEEIKLFSSEWHAFSHLSEHYKRKAPKKLIIVLGEQEFPVSPNY